MTWNRGAEAIDQFGGYDKRKSPDVRQAQQLLQKAIRDFLEPAGLTGNHPAQVNQYAGAAAMSAPAVSPSGPSRRHHQGPAGLARGTSKAGLDDPVCVVIPGRSFDPTVIPAKAEMTVTTAHRIGWVRTFCSWYYIP